MTGDSFLDFDDSKKNDTGSIEHSGYFENPLHTTYTLQILQLNTMLNIFKTQKQRKKNLKDYNTNLTERFNFLVSFTERKTQFISTGKV